jgi:hypothetical protein
MFYQFNQTLGFSLFKDAISLVPAFERIMKNKAYGEEAMKWMLAIYDVRSPYQSKYHNERDRIEAVNMDKFRKKHIAWEKDPVILDAIEKLRDHFYDSDFIQVQVYDEQIYLQTIRMKESKDVETITDIGKSLKALNELRREALENLKQSISDGVFDNIVYKKNRKPSMLTVVMEEQKVAERNAAPAAE